MTEARVGSVVKGKIISFLQPPPPSPMPTYLMEDTHKVFLERTSVSEEMLRRFERKFEARNDSEYDLKSKYAVKKNSL